MICQAAYRFILVLNAYGETDKSIDHWTERICTVFYTCSYK